MQKSNDLLGKKLKEAKASFLKALRFQREKQSKKQEINKITTNLINKYRDKTFHN